MIDLMAGWVVVWLVAFGGRVCWEGACETRDWEGTTRAGKGGLSPYPIQSKFKPHAVRAFSAHSFLLLKKSVSPKAHKKKSKKGLRMTFASPLIFFQLLITPQPPSPTYPSQTTTSFQDKPH